MNKVKPRGPVPSLIGGTNGRPKSVQVYRKCKCSRCHTPLLAGQRCVDIPQLGGAFSKSRRVCDECFQQIIEKSCADMEEIKKLYVEHYG